MAANTFATLHFIHNPSGEGWRENYPTNVNVPGWQLGNVILNFANSRALCLDSTCSIFAFSVRNQGPPKSNYVTKFQTPVTGKVGQGGGVDEPGDCLVYRLSDSFGHSRQLELRGIPGSFILNQKLTPGGILGRPIWDNYVQSLLNQFFGFNIPYTGSPVVVVNSIITPSVGALAVVTTATAHGYNPGDVVKIKRVKGWKLANAYWKVQAVPSSTSFSLAQSTQFAFNAMTPGIVQKYNPGFSLYTAQNFNEVSFRKTGRPSFQQRGKSSARVQHL